jgi:hypothetical protein
MKRENQGISELITSRSNFEILHSRNKRIIISFFLACFSILAAIAQPALKYEDNQTLSWQESIQFYKYLENNFENCKLSIAGESDAGKPLHLFIISNNNLFDPDEVKLSGRAVIIVNNGIHPGESCGTDASAKFALEVLEHPSTYATMLDSVVICIVPILNVGGALNRGEFHRANQNGPHLHGFRANAINNDLNRDFVKLDTKNARSFVKIMRDWDPDILIDTHTSNGADYQYVITLITTQRNKLDAPLSAYMYDKMVPELFAEMQKTPYEMTPYVMSMDRRDPANGIIAFMDHPRYTTGYAALFNTLGITLETHIFKPFSDRVLSTYHFVKAASFYLAENKSDILALRAAARESRRQKKQYTLQWRLDTAQYDEFLFKGYDIKYRTSRLTGLKTYYFDRDSPWEKAIRNYSYYTPVKTIKTPDFYIVPSAWSRVVELLKLNDVEMYPISRDTTFYVEYYYIDDYNTTSSAYNGHYLHSRTKVKTVEGVLDFLAGDMFVPVNQAANEFIVQVLEPEAVDSYFNWNFFDPILSRKEYFSPYVFDEKAGEILDLDLDLKMEFESKQKNDSAFASNHSAQLRFIYERSPYSEKTLLRYPVARYYMEH